MNEQYPQIVQFIGLGVTMSTVSPANTEVVGAEYLLLESGDNLLLESGTTDALLLE